MLIHIPLSINDQCRNTSLDQWSVACNTDLGCELGYRSIRAQTYTQHTHDTKKRDHQQFAFLAGAKTVVTHYHHSIKHTKGRGGRGEGGAWVKNKEEQQNENFFKSENKSNTKSYEEILKRGNPPKQKKTTEEAIRSTHPIALPGRKRIKRKPKVLKGGYQTTPKNTAPPTTRPANPPSPCI